jgi:DNA transformation protein
MATEAHVEHARELLATIPDLRFRSMFGGVGVFSGDVMFALIAGDQLYLKTVAETRETFETAGSEPFAFDTATGRKATSYLSLPPLAHDDDAEARRWAHLALDTALAAKRSKVKPGRKPHDLGPGPWDE